MADIDIAVLKSVHAGCERVEYGVPVDPECGETSKLNPRNGGGIMNPPIGGMYIIGDGKGIYCGILGEGELKGETAPIEDMAGNSSGAEK